MLNIRKGSTAMQLKMPPKWSRASTRGPRALQAVSQSTCHLYIRITLAASNLESLSKKGTSVIDSAQPSPVRLLRLYLT